MKKSDKNSEKLEIMFSQSVENLRNKQKRRRYKKSHLVMFPQSFGGGLVKHH